MSRRIPDFAKVGFADVPDLAPAAAEPWQTPEAISVKGAYEAADIEGLLALLTEDALLTMPPEPLEYQGHAAIAEFFTTRLKWRAGMARMVPARANCRARCRSGCCPDSGRARR